MFGISKGDIITLAAVIMIIVICIRNLTVQKKRGTCSCGAKSCSGCALCNVTAQRKQ